MAFIQLFIGKKNGKKRENPKCNYHKFQAQKSKPADIKIARDNVQEKVFLI
jgi:hypothetical protein